jgi:quinone-modifying oxidoreductase, subunit QmoB
VPSGIEVIGTTNLERLVGSVGRFRAVLGKVDEPIVVECGSVILAPGIEECPESIGLGMAEAECGGLPRDVRVAAFIIDRPDRTSFMRAVRLARSLLSREPRPKVYILAHEAAASGTEELEYRQAQEEGLIVVRLGEWTEPVGVGDTMTIVDQPSGLQVILEIDLLVVQDGTAEELGAGTTAMERGAVSRGAASTVREGIFLLPSEDELSVAEGEQMAMAAATRAVTATMTEKDPSVAVVVDKERCSACLTCFRICPHDAAGPAEDGKATIDAYACQACGICVSACPSRALSLPEEQVDGLQGGL